MMPMERAFIIAVDFDGTIVEHEFPDIGKPVPAAFKWLKRFQELGARLILWTMRSDGRKDGTNPLADAVDFCRRQGVEFWAVNTNPQQNSWTDSPKAYAHLYVDDAAFGCPLRKNPRFGGRDFVDWHQIGPQIEAMLQPKQKEVSHA